MPLRLAEHNVIDMKDYPKILTALFVISSLFLGVFAMPTLIDFALGRQDIEPPNKFPDGSTLESFPFELWDQVLAQHVDENGHVNYQTISEDPGFLVFIDTLSRVAPETHPDFFPDERFRLAYYINAYNAFTIYGVVSNPGITSVQDVRVKSLAMLKEGQGFFYSLRFKMGKRWINLYDLENKIIRGFGDARIHAAINCASKSCPMLSNKAYIPQKLDKALGNAMTSMLNNSIHLEVDNANRQVRASEIFKWFLEDFNATSPTDLYNYWLPFLDEERRKMLEQAQAQNYTIQWTPYDWALNGPGLLPPEEG